MFPMPIANDPVRNSGQAGFSRTRKFCLWLVALTVAGCLHTEGTQPDTLDQQGETDLFEDPGPLTGSSSTANFPPVEAGGDEVHWICGQELLFQFKEFGASAEFTGELEIFRAGAIPVLGTAKTYRQRIDSDSQVVITAGMLDSLGDMRDTVAFTVLFTNPSRRTAVVLGLSYSRSQGGFSDSALPDTAPDFVKIYPRIDYRGRLLNGDSLPPPPGDGISRLRYYIPGTPFSGNAGMGTDFRMEDVAAGRLPIRLLRVTSQPDGASESYAEIFEVVGNGKPEMPEYRIGERVASKTLKGPVPFLDQE